MYKTEYIVERNNAGYPQCDEVKFQNECLILSFTGDRLSIRTTVSMDYDLKLIVGGKPSDVFKFLKEIEDKLHQMVTHGLPEDNND